jgi:hypothetical protein
MMRMGQTHLGLSLDVSVADIVAPCKEARAWPMRLSANEPRGLAPR